MSTGSPPKSDVDFGRVESDCSSADFVGSERSVFDAPINCGDVNAPFSGDVLDRNVLRFRLIIYSWIQVWH